MVSGRSRDEAGLSRGFVYDTLSGTFQDFLPSSQTFAVGINDGMPEHTFQLLKSCVGDLRGKRVAVLGLSYRTGVSDTRSTPTALLTDLIEAEKGEALICDPLAGTRAPPLASCTGYSGPYPASVMHRRF